ncbi:hypothetical protein BKA70DRAFT_1567986 [Coprinopsis sp. MPI-PUGE-AT-0042]|nr:hypothetical protein BKA70DRAFT_1567986 [Coprinopsis sp. MPI-PUGE-AT-0042]
MRPYNVASGEASTQLDVVLATIQVYITCLALVRFCSLPDEHKRKRKRYVYLLLVMIFLSILRFGVRLAYSSWTPPLSPTLPIDIQGVILGSIHEDVVTCAATVALSLAGDAFLAWRAAVVWDHHRFLKRVPGVVYGVYLGVCIASSIFKYLALHALAKEARSVSAVATAMIFARLLLTQKRVEKIARESGTFEANLPYRKVMRLLLESALPFTMVGIAGATAAALRGSPSPYSGWATRASQVILVLWSNALALGPQLIALRVISGVTWTSNAMMCHARPISQPIFFADDPVVSLVASFTDVEEDVGLETRGDSQNVGQVHIQP